MARRGVHKLSPAAIRNARREGLYGDGGGLWLNVGPAGNKSWLFRYMIDGRARTMGLGALHTVGLAEARERARAARLLVLDKKDPLALREEEHQQRRLEAAKAITFKAAAEQYIAAHEAGWRNAKHAAQWPATLNTYCYPVMGDLAVKDIDTAIVMKSIEPVWTEKPETAGRVRGRIEAVLDWATVRGFRAGDNPARWRGHLEHLLPARGKVAKVEHHAALPYAEVGAFVAELRQQEGTAARALEFTILTAARTGEAIGARWREIDLGEKVWTVPGERMKAGKEHRVPLSPRALEIVKAMLPAKGKPAADGFVFAGAKPGAPLSNMAFLMLLRRMSRDDLTTHGFRSTFRDWCAERTSYPSEVAEMALAHAVGDKLEAAYRRGDMFEKRRRLAETWATFCATAPKPAGAVGTVTTLKARRAAE